MSFLKGAYQSKTWLIFSICIVFITNVLQQGFAQYDTLLIVGKSSGATYSNIQSAIDATKAFPDMSVRIFIEKGTYREKVRVPEWNTNLIIEGEDRLSTILIYNDHFKSINRGRNSTFFTSTLSVEANDVVLRNLTIVNDAGPVGQAIALSLLGDRISVVNCTILGNQDTLYCNGEGRRQYLHNCFIEGTTDYIFGSATVWFESCVLRSLANSYVTAASTPKNQLYGFVFNQCTLRAIDGLESVYLGRPWRAYAKTVYLSCKYECPLNPKVWDDWSSAANRTTAYYAEYQEDWTSPRPDWTHKLTKKQAGKYTLKRVLSGWNPELN